MAAETDIDPMDIKIEVGLEAEQTYGGWEFEGGELIYSAEEDPLLTLKPIVVTTKLDEMRTISKDLTDLNAKEIISMLDEESKPKPPYSNTRNVENSVQIASFAKISTVIHSVNFKSRLKAHTSYIRNLKLWNQCKLCTVILKDFRKIPPKRNIATPLPIDTQNGPLESSSSKVEVKTETINDDDISEVKVKIEVIDISDSETETPVEPVIEPSEKTKKKTRYGSMESTSSTNKSKIIASESKSNETSSSTKKLKTIKPQNKNLESASSGKKTKSKENRAPPRLTFESSDEEEIALVNIKKKPVIPNPVSATQSFVEKFGLIVLLKMNKEEACVYRVNANKLVTDYYVTSDYDEYKLASMYPKEEKIVENYCCWHKREEVVTKICQRKNYPFTIQKFLRIPHSCHPGDCQCCCFTNHAGKSKEPQKKRRAVINKSIDLADSWIRSLLERNQAANIGLVAKAMSYIPKAQLKEKLVPTEPESYLENILLWLNYTGYISDAFKNTSELYVIGKSGHPLTTYSFDETSDREANKVRQSYASLDFETLETEFCCWYSREKLLLNLRTMGKVSPAALKLMQLSHPCVRNNCRCCCKPDNILQLKADIDILPSTLKHTTAYEKDVHPLTIRFNVKSKAPITKIKSNYPKTPNAANASTTAAILSDCARKQDKEELSITILSKFKNLKLGLTNNGELEAILNAPARNLSIAELKVLSDILALSTKQITELGLTAEEFCNRINNKSGQPTTEISNTSKISRTTRVVASAATENIEIEKPEMTSINAKDIPQDCVTSIEKPILLRERTPPNALGKFKPLKTPSVATKNSNQYAGKSVSNMFTSLSNLMEKKNKNYVDSFKTFFKNKVTTVVTMPEISNKFRSVTVARGKTTEQRPSPSPCLSSLPKIAGTFTLAKSNADATAGPSKSTKPLEKVVSCSSQATLSAKKSVANDQISATRQDFPIKTYGKNNKRKDHSDTNTKIKRIRVKDPSELLPVNTTHMQMISTQVPLTTTQVPMSTTATNPIPMWPLPITIKQESQIGFQSIAVPQQPVAIQINPNLQTQPATFIIGNNVGTSQGIQILNTSNLYQVNGNTIAPAAMSNVNPGTRFVALTPVQAANLNNISNINTADKSILAQILKHPQVQPFNVTAGNNAVPPLVPFRPTHVQQAAQPLRNVRMPVIIKKENSDT